MESKSPYQITRLESQEQLDALASEWTELINQVPGAPIFLTWEWIRTWWQHFGAGSQLWLLTARDAQGRLAGVAPLMRKIQRKGLLRLRVISFIGLGLTHPVHLDLLAHPSDPRSLLEAFIEFLVSQSKDWDVLSLDRLAQSSPLPVLLAKAGGVVCAGPETSSLYVPLPGSWEAYHRTLAKSLRRNLKYFRTKLEDDHPGSVQFLLVTCADELPAAMGRLEELNKARWQAKNKISNFAYTRYTEFQREFASLAQARGWLRLNRLRVSGQSVALCYNFLFHQRIYAQAIGFDLEWSGYSPGRLAIASSIQGAIQEGVLEYDWLGGDEAYKFAWTDQVRVEKEIMFSLNLRGSLWLRWASFKATFRKLLVEKARQWIPQAARERVNQLVYKINRRIEAQDEKSGS